MKRLSGAMALSPQDIAAARQAYPRVFRRPLLQRLQAGLLWAGLGFAVLGSLWRTGFFA